MGDLNEKYGGPNGAFAEACNLYRDREESLPAMIRAHAETLDKSRIAYCLGWAFSFTLRKRNMTITDEDLLTIARNKISYGDPQEFVNGFNTQQAE